MKQEIAMEYRSILSGQFLSLVAAAALLAVGQAAALDLPVRPYPLDVLAVLHVDYDERSRVPAKAKGAAAASGTAAADAPLSLGLATPEQLETIEGIGPVTAGKIVEYRDQRGGIASIEELEEIHGIGPATIERLRERLQP
jgi:competence ComEA-like helix-hairpin-helix protein